MKQHDRQWVLDHLRVGDVVRTKSCFLFPFYNDRTVRIVEKIKQDPFFKRQMYAVEFVYGKDGSGQKHMMFSTDFAYVVSPTSMVGTEKKTRLDKIKRIRDIRVRSAKRLEDFEYELKMIPERQSRVKTKMKEFIESEKEK